MSEDKECFYCESVEDPYEVTLPKVVWAVIWGLTIGALLYPFAAEADPTYAADLSEPLILVAKPELRDKMYGASILVVRPLGGDAPGTCSSRTPGSPCATPKASGKSSCSARAA